MRLIQIVNMLESLVIMTNLPLSAKDSFYLNNTLIAFEDKFNSYNKAKNNLLTQYGTSEDGLNFLLDKEENRQLFFKELYELDNMDIDITFDKIKVGLSKLEKYIENEKNKNPNFEGIETKHLLNVRNVIEFYDDTKKEEIEN